MDIKLDICSLSRIFALLFPALNHKRVATKLFIPILCRHRSRSHSLLSILPFFILQDRRLSMMGINSIPVGVSLYLPFLGVFWLAIRSTIPASCRWVSRWVRVLVLTSGIRSFSSVKLRDCFLWFIPFTSSKIICMFHFLPKTSVTYHIAQSLGRVAKYAWFFPEESDTITYHKSVKLLYFGMRGVMIHKRNYLLEIIK